jgi:hypothetical protein
MQCVSGACAVEGRQGKAERPLNRAYEGNPTAVGRQRHLWERMKNGAEVKGT